MKDWVKGGQVLRQGAGHGKMRIMVSDPIYRETGLHQNWNREYDSKLGRYIESDPIGLGGGINTYVYANASPIQYSDMNGLESLPDSLWNKFFRGMGNLAAGVCEAIGGISGFNDTLGKDAQAKYAENIKKFQAGYEQGVNNCIGDAEGKLNSSTQCWDPAAVTKEARKCVEENRAALDSLLRANDQAYGAGAVGQGPIQGIGEAARICKAIFG